MDFPTGCSLRSLELWQNTKRDQEKREINDHVRDDDEQEIASPEIQACHDCTLWQHHAHDVAEIPPSHMDSDKRGQGEQRPWPHGTGQACQTLDRIRSEEHLL